MHGFHNCYASVDPGVTGLDVVRGCQPQALGLTVRRDLIPVYLGWIIAWVVSPGIPGWECCDGDPRVAGLSVVRRC